MKAGKFRVLIFLFLFAFIFSYTVTIFAADQLPSKCCVFWNECGYMGTGSYQNGHCGCCIPNNNTGCFQGWYEGCFHMCPASCIYRD